MEQRTGRFQKKRFSFRVSLLALFLAMVATVSLAGCHSSGGGTGARTAVLVTQQRAGDHGPVDNMIAGLHRAIPLGYKVKVVEDTDSSSFTTTLTDLGQEKVNIVIVAFPQFATALKTVAPHFRDTTWVHLYADPYKPAIPNVVSLRFDTQSPAYLAGYLAARVSKTHTVGFVGGTAIPAAYADYHAFVAGAQAGRPGVRVKDAFVGSYQDPVLAQSIASNLYRDGADVVLTLAGGSSPGVVTAATERGALVITDGTDAPSGARNVIGVASQDYGQGAYLQLKAYAGGSWKSGFVTYGLRDGITYLHPAPQFARSAPAATAASVADAFKRVAQIRQQIINGTVKVPFNTSGV